MSRALRLVRRSPCLKTYLQALGYRSQTQAYKHDIIILRPSSTPVRHMGILKDFSDGLKGELTKNAELKKSVEQFKEKAVHFRDRTKEATNQIYNKASEVGEHARRVSAEAKEQVNVAKDKVVGMKTKVTESVSAFKIRGLKGSNDSFNFLRSSFAANDESSQKNSTTKGLDWLFKGFRNLFSSGSTTLYNMTGSKVFGLIRKGYYSFIEELTVTSSKRRLKAQYSAVPATERSTSTDLVPVTRKQTAWEKRWGSWRDKVQSNPLYKRVRGIKSHPIVTKSQEIAEDVRERWETSDSPVVHKIQDLNDSLFGETSSAVAVKEIRQRDPYFSFPDFLVEVQESTRPVLQAYLKGDLKELQKRCSREVVDRCRAERMAYESQGIFMDSKLLHVSDVEVKETKLLGNTPIIIVGFQTQQIYCVRDRHGRITQGAKDDIQTVFYAWAMQQVLPDDYQNGVLYPYWQLREMQQLGIKSII